MNWLSRLFVNAQPKVPTDTIIVCPKCQHHARIEIHGLSLTLINPTRLTFSPATKETKEEDPPEMLLDPLPKPRPEVP